MNKSICKVMTKETDIRRTLLAAAPIIVAIKQTVVKFVLQETGRESHAYAADLVPQNHVAFPNEETHAARQVRIIAGKATPFLEHLEPWKAAVAVSPKTRDEYEAAIREFAARVNHPIEDLTQAHVQYWVDGLLSANEDDSLDAKTVNKKLSGLRNYWGYMSLRGPVERGRRIFNDLDVRNRTGHVSIKMARYLPKDVVRLWRVAETSGNESLATMIKIAAYTGGRRAGIASLKVSDIKVDPDTGVRFIHTTGKTDAGDRDVPSRISAKPSGRVVPDGGAPSHTQRTDPAARHSVRNSSSLAAAG